MPLIMYEIRSVRTNSEQIVDFINYRDELYKFFIQGDKNDVKIEHFNICLKAQSGFTEKQIETFDFLQCSVAIPIFSQKFIQLLGNKLKNDLEFYPCTVLFKEKKYPFFMGFIKKRKNIISEEKSGVFTLSDGEEMIDEPIYYKKVENKLNIVRDIKWHSSYIVTENFKMLVVENKLKMEFYPAHIA